MKKTVHYEGSIEITIYDEKIPDILKSYQESIDESGTVDDLFESIAHHSVYCGAWGFIEGIGEHYKDYEINTFDKPELDVLD